jgi:isoquinoline 1-oxidoreductase beta subunit
MIVNPDIVEAQIEGSIVFGLTAALTGEITVENGQVQQSNFHDYTLLRLDEMPTIEIYLVPSTEAPTGAGKSAVPTIAPAVTNAIFAATGKRVRRLPIRPEDLQTG